MNLRNIESIRINQLKIIQSLLKTRSVSETAHAMSLTQSAISKTLAVLRSDFEDGIFIKTKHGMEPTSFGTSVAPLIEDILKSMRQIESLSSSFTPAQTTETLTIACNDFFQAALLMRTVPLLQQQAPHLKVQFHPYVLNRSVEQLISGEISLLIGQIDSLSANIDSTICCHSEQVLVLAESHQLASEKSITTKDVGQAQHIQVLTETQTNQNIRARLIEAGEHLFCPLMLSSFGPVASLLGKGGHVAVMPKEYVTIYSRFFPLTSHSLPFEMPQLAMQVNWHRRNRADPFTNWVVDHIQATFSPNEN